MANLKVHQKVSIWFLVCLLCTTVFAREHESADDSTKVYVPYEQLHEVLGGKEQGVFLPYREFQRLWQSAQAKPAGIEQLPFDYLISVARLTGRVEDKVARMRLELTMDILKEDWINIPIGLGEVAVFEIGLLDTPDTERVKPLLRLVDGRYVVTTKGAGRRTLAVDFVCQIDSQPGLNILKYGIPSASITTLELLIPEENMKVDVKPMLAATTSQMDFEGRPGTKLQAFLGSAKDVHLSWKPRSESAADLDPVVISEQFQDIHVGEALIKYNVRFDYTIHRGGVDYFEVMVPKDFRITDVIGDNIAKWDIQEAGESTALQVKLFTPAKEKYSLNVKMERFLQENSIQVPLKPIATKQIFRRSGLISVNYSPRRRVHLKDISNLVRVDRGRLPKHLQNQSRVTAYRFITSDYGAVLDIKTAAPRIEVRQYWMMGLHEGHIQYDGKLNYSINNTGIFNLSLQIPDNWNMLGVHSTHPANLVDDHQVEKKDGGKILNILLKKEVTGALEIQLSAYVSRPDWRNPVFELPLPEMKNLKRHSAQLLLMLPEQLRAQVDQTRQASALPLKKASRWRKISGKTAAMAFNFQSIDRGKPADVKFKIETKPTQISATTHRWVNVQPGVVEQQAVIHYDIRYSPVNTLYLQVPKEMANAELKISGSNIKEKPRLDKLPANQVLPDELTDPNDWAYYKIVLQSKIKGRYELKVHSRKAFQAGTSETPATVAVLPILAAGKLSSQKGFIAVQKADTLAIGTPEMENLNPADPGSEDDLPYGPHRKNASLAFKYSRPPFGLSMPVVAQKEAKVFTTIVNGTLVEQILARDGRLNTRALFLLATSQGDRLPITLPEGAELTAVLINGQEAPVETGVNANERIVRLPSSAGQVVHFQLEVAYSVKDVGPWSLTPPALPTEIPVQQTLWRLWLPEEDHVLGHNRVFSKVDGWQAQNILNTFAAGQTGQVAFKLTGQGKVVHFLRQGGGGQLSLVTMRKEIFNVVLWIVIIAAGVWLLRLSGYRRLQIVLAGVLVGGVLNLFMPLLVERLLVSGALAVGLVLLLWVGHWLFYQWPKIQQGRQERKKSLQSRNAEAVVVTETETKPQDNKE